uniref:Aminotransferase-like plant mobile domain-containing protein n=1 Tax=Setaria italica TaxID=4555 RepID=K3YMS9_SETIT
MKLIRRYVLGPSRQVCMISDHHHGLLNCANDHMDGFPPLVHRWCMRHFAANMWRCQKNKEVIGKLKVLCIVHTEKEFDEKLEDLVKDLNDEAKQWLKGEVEDKDKWAQAFKWSVNKLPEPYGLERMVYCVRGVGSTNVGDESHGGQNYRESSFEPYLDPSQWPPYEGLEMADPAYPLLEAAYDVNHCGHLLADHHEELKPLQLRVHSPLRWDECYASYLQRAGFLDIARVVAGGLPLMDGPMLTTMVNRWRLETHMFHLPCGEMTVAMILGLPLEGLPVTAIIQSDNWHDMVELHIRIRPPEPEEGDKEKKTSEVSLAWLREQFSVCPQGAYEEVVERHLRVLLWHFVSGFLLTDAAGNTVSWMDNIRGYSWGSVLLAWLYRQLCDACRRTAKDANFGGCAYLLQIWIWERILACTRQDSFLMFAYVWKHADPIRGPPARWYKFYTNELDCVTQTQINSAP